MNIIRKLRGLLGRLKHEYDGDLDWWEYASQSSKRAVLALTDLKEKGNGINGHRPLRGNGNVQGVSLDGEGREEWKAMLDDMIFFHRVVAGEIEARPITYKYSLGKQKGKMVTHSMPPEFMDLTPEEQQRYRRGKYYYMSRYESLWD